MINHQRFSSMKNSPLLTRPVLLAAALPFLAAPALTSAQGLEDAEGFGGWFARVDAAARFNLKASMKTLPVTLPARVYDNGSVLPDIGGTASGLTWNWSYQSASQISYDVNNQPQAIVFQRLDNVPTAGGEVNLNSPMVEGEVIAGYRFDDFHIGKRRARAGIEIGYGYFSSSKGMDFQSSGSVIRTIDTYGLGGVIPPMAPYAGTYQGPGPLIDLSPSQHTTQVFSSLSTFQSSFDASFHNFRFGPFFGIDLTPRFAMQVGFGYDSVMAEVDLHYHELSAYVPGGTDVSAHASKWRLGFYAELLFSYKLSNHLGLFLGGDFTHNSDFTFSSGLHEFTFELGSTYAGKGGIIFSF